MHILINELLFCSFLCFLSTVTYNSDIFHSRFKDHMIVSYFCSSFDCICTFLAQFIFPLLKEILRLTHQMKNNKNKNKTLFWYQIVKSRILLYLFKKLRKKRSELSVVVLMCGTFKEAQRELLSLHLPLLSRNPSF